MLVVAVDPGMTGAISLLCSRRGLLECADLPTCENGQKTGSMRRWLDVAGLMTLLADWSSRHDFAREAVHAVIERPIAMPSLPAQTIASQFDLFGAVRAVLSGVLRRDGVAFVEPRQWKRFYALGSDKDESISTALRLYPSAKVLLARKKDHNRSESILIGHFALHGGDV